MHSCMKTASSVSSGKGSCSVMCLILWRSLFGVSFIWSHLQVTLKHHSIGIFSFSALTYMDRCFPLFTKKIVDFTLFLYCWTPLTAYNCYTTGGWLFSANTWKYTSCLIQKYSALRFTVRGMRMVFS